MSESDAHRCDETCMCPIHGTPLIYSPARDDHACQDVNCKYGHGGIPATPSFPSHNPKGDDDR